MKSAWIVGLFSFLVVTAAGEARAGLVTFDFNSLGFFGRDAVISEYMTDVYGSTVTTDGARISNERTDPGGSTNKFIATSIQLLNRGDFIILFGELPIIGAEFEGHVIDATPGDDFNFTAFNGDTLVLSYTRDDGVEIFDSGWIDFPEPVNRIVVSDSGWRDVGIDNFVVQPVPEPATVLLAIIGTAVLYCRHRR